MNQHFWYLHLHWIIQQIIKQSGKAAGSDERKRELAAARKMTLIVATDFCCWIPINLMGTYIILC